MNIYSFHKISRPIYEGGATIDLTPKGQWFVQVRRTDGTFRYPFGDRWIDNLFLTGYVDGQLGGGQFPEGKGWASEWVGNRNTYTFLDYFYGGKSSLAIGSGTTPVTAGDTALANQIRFDSTPFATGNFTSWNSSNGNLNFTIKEQFPVETGSVTYNEAGFRITQAGAGGSTGWDNIAINGLTAAGATRLVNRVVFPSGISLVSGEQLIITISITIPSLASTGGRTITISAQNGMNISGVLKLIGSAAAMVGGTVSQNGIISPYNVTHPTLFDTAVVPVGLLSTKTTFDTLGVDPTWGTTNQVNGQWGTYTNGSRVRDIGFQWNSGTPATDTAFRSILFREITDAGARGGYQLLLDNEMTKASSAVLSLALRFSI